MIKKVEIEPSWYSLLEDEFNKEYFIKLREFIKEEYSTKTVYPRGRDIFSAFNSTPVDHVKAVIIGQDPYHGPGQAHGLCFSVPDGIKKPPSLVNIFKEISDDIGCDIPDSGNLKKWTREGVLLLNSSLSVIAGKANSHKDCGWEQFTNSAISKLSSIKKNIVFLLWGNYAIKKEDLIDKDRHLILKTVHPSPLSAYNGFFGCKHFSKTNEYLSHYNKTQVNWNLT